MECVVLYRLQEGADRARLIEVYPRHRSYYQAFREGGGGLVALGPFLNPDALAGSLGLFTSRTDAEEFVAHDPFVLEGLAQPHVFDWDPVRFE